MYLATQLQFLFRPGGYRFVDSIVSTSGGDAMVVLESAILRLQLTRDRSQLLLTFQPLRGKRSQWFSPGLLRGLMTGERPRSEVLDEEWARFLKVALPELEKRLGDPVQGAQTLNELRVQARLRAKELFG
jgi:hypothetical protein